MAPSIKPLSLLIILLCAISLAAATASSRPKALVLPIFKDAFSLQYITTLTQRTPPLPIRLTLDLGGKFLWVDCDTNYTSSTYRPARCGSAQCSLARASCFAPCLSSPRPGCFNNTCGLLPYNSVTDTFDEGGQVGSDVLSAASTDGSNPGPTATVNNLLFVCAPFFLANGLASGATGMAGLGRARIGLPSLLAAAFSFDRKFAICLPSSASSSGVLFFGPGPYSLLPPPGTDFSQSLQYTPLHINPVSTAPVYTQSESTEYFIGVKSITIGSGSPVPLNSTLLKIDPSHGVGGTKLSTVIPYTFLETSIYTSLLRVYAVEAAARNITTVPAPASTQFGLCFNRTSVLSTRVGWGVPAITLSLEGEKADWIMTGSNLIVDVSEEVLCLGFIDAGVSGADHGVMTSIVIGGHQLQDNLLEFDLARSRLGFSSTLLGRQTTCSNFNFTSNA